MKTNVSFHGLVIAARLGLLVLVSALGGTGCVAVIPTVSPGHGQSVKREETAFIRAGQTTREEVVQRLGGNFRDLASPSPAVAYSWELRGMDFNVFLASSQAVTAGQFGFSRWRALFIAFDPKGVVTRYQFVSPSGRRSLDDQLRSWTQTTVSASPRISPQPVDRNASLTVAGVP